MSIMAELRESGAIVTSKSTDLLPSRNIVKVWFRTNSDALSIFVDSLIRQMPGIMMFNFLRPGPTNADKTFPFGWSCHKQYVSVMIDTDDCRHTAKATCVSLRDLLSRIAENGCEDAMAFRISMDVQVWDKVVATADFAS
ncbi:MAG: hypothetical protein OXI77_07060 [Chloroflexota bacterium]|nr:hypothetical protein [Chloroflexota bacterium]MDE2908401.1 hypothetical protein [Chloroflexota bacterium]